MDDKSKACMLAYKKLAVAIIDSAMEDLKESSPSASQFFGSDWFSYLCKVAQVNNQKIRAAAYRQPGFITRTARRSLMAVSRAQAIASGRKRNRRGKPFVKLVAIPPNGEAFDINGYTNAAKILGCSSMAIKYATEQGRPCLGWRFKKRVEVSK
jgi:hypothetical protein